MTRWSTRWSREELLDLLRADAVAGVAPSTRTWRAASDRPSERTIASEFGSWVNFVAEAGLRSRRQERRQAAIKPPPETPHARSRRERRDEELAEIQRQIDDGELRAFRLTPSQRMAYEQQGRRVDP
jgi:Homing endonuclease associated repeat